MKAATLNELKQEITTLTPKQVLDICMRLAKHKKENKELITYLLFEANDEETFIKNIKDRSISFCTLISRDTPQMRMIRPCSGIPMRLR